ncbi:MAG: hypothetical protein OXU34_02055 [Gammaproteobacteria bacterium]|nr:hypothetical protein [Gammaproteobacteria bacterium]
MKKSAEKKASKPNEVNDGVMAALKRAARRAHLIAHLTGTKVVIMRDDEVVEIDPDPEMYEGLKMQAHEAAQYLAKVGGSAPDIKPVPRRRFD